MKVQKGKLGDGKTVWLVLDDDCLPVESISKYLRYLDSLERSPNTLKGFHPSIDKHWTALTLKSRPPTNNSKIRLSTYAREFAQGYARNLKFYWEFLKDNSLDWRSVNLEQLSEFIHWLRNPQPNVIPFTPQESKRSEKTINHALTTVTSFYEFYERLGEFEGVDFYKEQRIPNSKYKPFLHHISKGKLTKTRLLKVKEPKTFPGCLTSDEVKNLINGCNRIRDRFLICLLYETGVRIGEALGLRHEDLKTGEQNKIHVVPRQDNFNDARAKGAEERTIHVGKDLLRLYSDYLIDEYPEEIDSDYVFVNIWSHAAEVGTPMTYSAVDNLFRRLHKKTGLKASPHLFRHTHATELIRAGWDMSYVQKRLGHADIQTTINTYVHLLDDDLQEAYKKYLQSQEEK